MSKVLVINAGSSSMKVALLDSQSMEVIAEGIAERIGLNVSNISFKFNGKKFTKELKLDNHAQTVKAFLSLWKEINLYKDSKEITHIGFRAVNAGPTFTKSEILTDSVLQALTDNIDLAPLHNPAAIASIKAFKKEMPHAKLSVSFDTAFHSSMPKLSYVYPVPLKWTKELGIRKYGAHGTSHLYITKKMEQILSKQEVNIVSAHIGNGASITAVKHSKSLDTSMGLTPLAGVMMGTRSGDIDPSIAEFVMNKTKMSITEFTQALNKDSGLKGVSGVSSDMRDVISKAEEGDVDAEFALELYSQKIADYIVIYLNKLGHCKNIDAIVFTAGVGENSSVIRKKVVEKLRLVNIEIDLLENEKRPSDYLKISTNNSAIAVYVVPTNEEYVIAKDALDLH
ncbi:acetate kinase [Mycoplasma testudineum]|uniref:Acetate kinase n=1 Tax=Mycoplasma testudineum TaxID=244584 RepID=A0A4R6IGC1_9MOLU|nr:acetate/propionate family kinase [Mycoplasma testudineum]OYD27043.1 acetate kinase [Mycoplasma testudineum]TDO21202.1 acetate kinase [Mycoplasma testudineum]